MQISKHKRTKFGMLPGDIPKHDKIALLEGKTPLAKSYKKDFVRKANRRTRHSSPSVTEAEKW